MMEPDFENGRLIYRPSGVMAVDPSVIGRAYYPHELRGRRPRAPQTARAAPPPARTASAAKPMARASRNTSPRAEPRVLSAAAGQQALAAAVLKLQRSIGELEAQSHQQTTRTPKRSPDAAPSRRTVGSVDRAARAAYLDDLDRAFAMGPVMPHVERRGSRVSFGYRHQTSAVSPTQPQAETAQRRSATRPRSPHEDELDRVFGAFDPNRPCVTRKAHTLTFEIRPRSSRDG